MNIVRHENIHSLTNKSRDLLKNMLSPFCGLNQEIGYVSRSATDMRMMAGSAALTGVHVLFDRPNPGRGAYHIGGTGILPNESMIRILGETVERYTQLMSDFSCAKELKYASYAEMMREEENILSMHHTNLYSHQQLSRPGFPFKSCDVKDKLSWIKMYSCIDQSSMWVPAQLVLVGYNIKQDQGEPWITSAVTTGTAAHTTVTKAYQAALLELIQLDSVMGHWYSNAKAYEIKFDARVSSLKNLITEYTSRTSHRYIFYYLPNPDLAGFSIACVYLQDQGLPKVVIGLGADLSLEQAMYKAFIETVSAIGLSRMTVFKGAFALDKHQAPLDVDHLYDLDRNIQYYGAGNGLSRIQERFLFMSTQNASELPPDIIGNDESKLEKIISTFNDSNKQLYYLNLTGPEEKKLGFSVMRVWSPDTLSLCLPSAPAILHSRFKQYGGIKHADPHPYP